MQKKIFHLLLVLPVLIALAACTGTKTAGTDTTNNPSQANTANFAAQPVEDKLALGTLSLEGTEKAVTAEQAKALLPLWKAIKSLSASDTASADEIRAVYTQIQETMTAGQVQAIKDLNLSPTDMQALMAKYGVQMQAPQGGTPVQNATRAARTQSQGGALAGGRPGGGMAGGPQGGGMPPDGGAGMPGGMQGTPRAGQGGGRGFRGGMNNRLVDPIITLLTERAGA